MIDRATASTLAHDVGKYVARVAMNVAPGEPVPAALIPLLVKDLYELPGGRASACFEALARGLTDPRLDRAREHLTAIDALEERVRAGDASACSEACAQAREIHALLSALAKR